jgi:hypothetical protein
MNRRLLMARSATGEARCWCAPATSPSARGISCVSYTRRGLSEVLGLMDERRPGVGGGPGQLRPPGLEKEPTRIWKVF